MSNNFTQEVEIFFKERGFTGSEFRIQMQALSDLIAFTVYSDLKKEFPEMEKHNTAEGLKKFLSGQLSEKELHERIGKVGIGLMKEYTDAIE